MGLGFQIGPQTISTYCFCLENYTLWIVAFHLPIFLWLPFQFQIVVGFIIYWLGRYLISKLVGSFSAESLASCWGFTSGSEFQCYYIFLLFYHISIFQRCNKSFVNPNPNAEDGQRNRHLWTVNFNCHVASHVQVSS